MNDRLNELSIEYSPDKTNALHKHLLPLEPFITITRPHKKDDGFRVFVFDDGKKFVGTANYTQVVNFDQLPTEVSNLLLEQKKQGIKTYLGKIAVDNLYQKKGVGTALWKSALAKISQAHPSFIEFVQDDSVVGWTEKNLPAKKQFMEELGYKANPLWTGVIDGKKSWIINYQKS